MNQDIPAFVSSSFSPTSNATSRSSLPSRCSYKTNVYESLKSSRSKFMACTRITIFKGEANNNNSNNNNKSGIRMSISSNEFRTGTTIELDGIPYRVVEFLHVKPGKGAAFVRSKLKNLKTGNNVDKTFKAGETVQQAQLEKLSMQHTYVDGDDFVFMNMESYEEERMTRGMLGENVVKFLLLGQEVEVLKHNEDVIGVDLPKTLIFKITSTEPGVKGNTASGNVLKPATLDTGAEVMVPLFINIGDQVKINTEDGKYLGRSNE